MCLDWIGRHDEATTNYDEAVKLDPEGRITSFYRGWHAMQRGNDAEAREWFLKSTQQGWPPYREAETYLWILERRKADRAPSPPPAPSTNSLPR
jgi:tetratricopeptide (TPR) repeat protein